MDGLMPKITTTVKMLQPEQKELPNVPKILYFGSDYQKLYKANEPIQILSDNDIDEKIGAVGLGQKIKELKNSFTTKDAFNDETLSSVVVQVEMQIPLQEKTITKPASMSQVTISKEIDYGTNISMNLQYNNTDESVTYKFKIFDKEVESKITATTDDTEKTVKFVVSELDNTEFTITLAQLQDFNGDVVISYYKKPQNKYEELLAIEYATNMLDGYPADWVVYDDRPLGDLYKDDFQSTEAAGFVTQLKQAVQAGTLEKPTSVVDGELDCTVDETIKTFYKYNDHVIRLAEFVRKNCDSHRRLHLIAKALQPTAQTFGQLKQNIQDLKDYAKNITQQKYIAAYGELISTIAIYKNDINCQTAELAGLIISKSLDEVYLNVYINSLNGNIQNIIPYKYAEELLNLGYIIAKKDGLDVVVPALRTMNNTNKQSVRTIKLINSVLNSSRDICKKFIGRVNSEENRIICEDEINNNIRKNYISTGRVAFGLARVKSDTQSVSIGKLKVLISLTDYNEIGIIEIELNYSKQSN